MHMYQYHYKCAIRPVFNCCPLARCSISHWNNNKTTFTTYIVNVVTGKGIKQHDAVKHNKRLRGLITWKTGGVPLQHQWRLDAGCAVMCVQASHCLASLFLSCDASSTHSNVSWHTVRLIMQSAFSASHDNSEQSVCRLFIIHTRCLFENSHRLVSALTSAGSSQV